MSMSQTKPKDRVPFIQKSAFGAGHLALNLLPGALGVFSFFLLTAFGMDPLLAGILGGLPRVYDAITDPIMGFISDNTKSKWGRRRPYIFVGAILSGIFYILLWQMSPENSQMYNFWYFLIFSLIFLTGNTIFATPLVGLGYEMTTDYNERTRLMGFANTVGQIAWMIVPWFWVIIANPEMYATQVEGVNQLAVYVGILCMVLGVLPALFCKGIDAAHMDNRKEISFKTIGSSFKDLFFSIKQVSQNKPFMKLCAATFLVFNGFQIVASFSVFIIVFYMYNGSYEGAGTWPAWFATVSAILTAFFVIPVVTRISNIWGKKNAFIIASVISMVGYLLKWWGFDKGLNNSFNNTNIGQSMNQGLQSFFDFISPTLQQLNMSWFVIDTSNGVPWLMFFPIPLLAFGLGSLFTLMMSMTADVCDLDELNNGMPRKEGTFGAIYWWMVKLGQGLALVIGGFVLKAIGFDGGLTAQSAETLVQLRLMDIFIPTLTAGIAAWVMWNYDLSEEKAREIKAELVKRRGEL
ncbi:MAG: MFS transporter [Saprospiraceae bacterium]|nr:MFS transporter [Saprospiraceae bacterium]MBK8548637.1 MFS transporter [Saprospiraceae bacterium]